ncbi:MAG: hypothetical protein KAH77_01480 [Thiomargarita sp.]|nr:hypothetical protein [Thiomargarita sp.]
MRNNKMKILHVMSSKEFLKQFLQVTLKDSKVKAYSTASICTIPNMVSIPQRYVLEPILARLLRLDSAFIAQGVDILNLDCAITYKYGKNTYTIMPPVIEHDGNMLADGMHRVYYARQRGITARVVYAQNNHPYYAYPLQNGWDDVMEIPILTSNFKRKEYKEPDNHTRLFRDYNKVFEGVQVKRVDSAIDKELQVAMDKVLAELNPDADIVPDKELQDTMDAILAKDFPCYYKRHLQDHKD